MRVGPLRPSFFFVIVLLVLVKAIYDFVVANAVYLSTSSALKVALTFLIAYIAEIVVSLFFGGFADGNRRLHRLLWGVGSVFPG